MNLPTLVIGLVVLAAVAAAVASMVRKKKKGGGGGCGCSGCASAGICHPQKR